MIVGLLVLVIWIMSLKSYYYKMLTPAIKRIRIGADCRDMLGHTDLLSSESTQNSHLGKFGVSSIVRILAIY